MSFLSEEIQKILAQAAENVVNRAKQNLDNGELKNSIKYTEGDSSIQIIMEEYGLFQDKGVTGANKSDFNGKKKQLYKSEGNFKFSGNKKAIGGKKSIDQFITEKGISSKFYSKDQLNFLIRRSIYQHGIKPSLFLTKPYEKYREEIIEEFNKLHEQIIKDIDNG
jgi:hypothetical protein